MDFYCGWLGMQLICVEPVKAYGFDLYFLAFTEERPPAELAHVRNRECLGATNRLLSFEKKDSERNKK